MTQISRNESLDHFRSLETHGLAYHDCGDDEIDKIVPYVSTGSGLNLIWLIKEYVSNDKEKLKVIIVDRNFSIFD